MIRGSNENRTRNRIVDTLDAGPYFVDTQKGIDYR